MCDEVSSLVLGVNQGLVGASLRDNAVHQRETPSTSKKVVLVCRTTFVVQCEVDIVLGKALWGSDDDRFLFVLKT